MKRITAFMMTVSLIIGALPVFAEEVNEIEIYVPYTKTALTASDLNMTALYNDESFTNIIEKADITYGDKLYASDGSENFIITPLISYMPEYDSVDYYFEFDGNLETNTEKGAYNKITPTTNTEELTFLDDGTIEITPDTTVTDKQNYTTSAQYTFEKNIVLPRDKEWRVALRFHNKSKTGMMFTGNTAAWAQTVNHIGIFENRVNFIRNKRGDIINSKYNAIWRMVDVTLENRIEDGSGKVYMNLSSDGGNTWVGEAAFDDEAVGYSEVDTDIAYAFSWKGGTNAFIGIFDYAYFEPNLYYKRAMEFVNEYTDVLSGTVSDIESVAETLNAYYGLEDGVRAELKRGEGDAVIRLRRLLASGDCTISSAFSNPVNITGGDGTEENPYTAELETDYGKMNVTSSDFTTTDEYAEIKADGELTGIRNEINAEVTSAENKAYYKFTVYPLKDAGISDIDAQIFIMLYKDILKKTKPSAEDKQTIEQALSMYQELPDTAKAQLIRNEENVLKDLYLQTVIESINKASTVEEMIAGAENDIGIYSMTEYMAEYILKRKPSGGFTETADFDKVYTYALAVNAIHSGEDAAKVINDNSSILISDESDIAQNYTLLSEKEKERFAVLAKEADFINSYSLDRVLREAMILAEVQCADSAAGLKNAVMGTNPQGETINNNFKLIGVDEASYSRLKSPEKVFSYMYKNISNISSFNDIAKYFNAACKSVAADEAAEEDKKRPSGGGGGSAGGAGGGVAPNIVKNVETVKNTAAPEAEKKTFLDIDGHWGKDFITVMVNRGVVSGYEDGTFRPDNVITRAEFIKLAVEAFEINTAFDSEFEDSHENDWYFEYINRAAGSGMIKGSDTNCVYPNSEISREDAVVIMYRYIKNHISFPNKAFFFKDNSDISDYCREAVNDMAYAGIVSGTGSNRFNPKSIMTRAEAVTLISNTLDYMGGEA